MLKSKLLINLQLFAASSTPSPEDIEALKAQIEAMKAQAEEDKARIADLQAKSANAVANSDQAEVASVEEFLEQRVPIMLFKDGDKYVDDVVIAINNEKIVIQRGITVYVKRKFLHIIENMYRQQMVATDLQTQLANEFAGNAKEMGIDV
jgi:translation initiation factor 1 (eIF-1/SUI1)